MDDILSQIIAYAPDRIDTETKARAMVQGPRNMYNQGQLVQPNADGSRPGYAGDDFVNLNDIKKYNKNLLDKSIFVSTAPGKTGANQADPVTLRNIFNVVEKTKDGDVLINNFKKNPTSENFLKLRTRRKNRLAFEKEQALPTEQKAELRKKQLIAEKKWRASGKGQSYYNELLAKDGIFPARTAQERVWRDIYRASKQSKEDSRFKIKYPKNIEIDPETNLPKKVKAKSGKYYIPWDRYYKNISFYDTETKSTIKFGNMREWMKNNVKGGGKKYDNAIQNYNIRQNIADFDVDGKSLGAVAKEKKTGLYAKKLTTPAAVNHISGLNNFWDTEITTSTGNAQLNDKVQSRISAYKNASNPNIKNKIMKQMKAEINKIQGGATLVVDGETIGKKPTLRKVSNALAKELDVDLSQLINDIGPCGAGKKKAMGGRIGLKTAGDVCMTGGRQTIAEFLKNGFKNANGEQKEIFKKILSLGGGAIKGVGSMLDPRELFKIKNLVGPAAWAAMGAFETGAITYDVVNNNIPLNEVLGSNWITKFATPYTLKEAQIKNLEDSGASLSPAAKEYMAQTKLMAQFERELKALEGMKMGVFGTETPKELIQDQEKKLENIVKDVVKLQASPVAGGAGQLDFDKAFSEMAEKRGAGYYDPENDDANEYGYVDVGDSIFGFKKGTPLTYKYKKDRGKDQGRNLSETEREAEKLFPFETGTLRADYTPFNYKSFNYTPQELPADMVKQYEKDYKLPPRTSLNQFNFKGSDNNVLQDLTNEYNMTQRAKQASKYPGYGGTQSPYSEGGIASLNVKK